MRRQRVGPFHSSQNSPLVFISLWLKQGKSGRNQDIDLFSVPKSITHCKWNWMWCRSWKAVKKSSHRFISVPRVKMQCFHEEKLVILIQRFSQKFKSNAIEIDILWAWKIWKSSIPKVNDAMFSREKIEIESGGQETRSGETHRFIHHSNLGSKSYDAMFSRERRECKTRHVLVGLNGPLIIW